MEKARSALAQEKLRVDLVGHTFWELKGPRSSMGRRRRMVQFDRGTHLGDVQISPQWLQWLRHTRLSAPSLHEQQLDVQRQVAMVQLARLADERWASKPSFLDPPAMRHLEPPALKVEGEEGLDELDAVDAAESPVKAGHAPTVAGEKSVTTPGTKDPWAASQSAGREAWQPAPWSPNVVSSPSAPPGGARKDRDGARGSS
ncbi:MAG: hypothetical protein M1826_003290 [Phylliscum demangeonii]|nr:MAG: hypothetical protein M1826_003290 [Phylliscum demangeonii]